ncbi:MAG: hypothetical protein EBR02_01935 [Alphaproteobacteria bacterium]|nr:hypothetical protein [Alphaproteobacteria bacterium]
MSDKQSLSPLKTLVFSMGIVLIAGAVFISGGILKNFSASPAALSADCKGGQLDLTGRGMVVESRTEDQIMRLSLEKKPGSMEILTVDVCSGKILGSLQLNTDPGMGVE